MLDIMLSNILQDKRYYGSLKTVFDTTNNTHLGVLMESSKPFKNNKNSWKYCTCFEKH